MALNVIGGGLICVVKPHLEVMLSHLFQLGRVLYEEPVQCPRRTQLARQMSFWKLLQELQIVPPEQLKFCCGTSGM